VERIFALYDSDVFYATRFMEYFKKKKDSDFTISVFTRKESLEEYLRSHSVEILLLGDTIAEEKLDDQKIKYIYRLTDKPARQIEEGYPAIYRYQPAGTVINEIINDYQGKENLFQAKDNSVQTNILSVFSPVPGIDKIIFSWAVANLLSEQGSVLYIPLELLPVSLYEPVDRANQALTEFIYYLKENIRIEDKIKVLPRTYGGLSVLSGLVHGFDLLSLSKADIKNWVEELKTHRNFHTVVFYIGCYTEAMIELMQESDEVLVAASESTFEMVAIKEWERQMSQMGMPEKQDKVQYIMLPREEEILHLPASISELKNSAAFDQARQYLNC
jgi:hypothetical protein